MYCSAGLILMGETSAPPTARSFAILFLPSQPFLNLGGGEDRVVPELPNMLSLILVL